MSRSEEPLVNLQAVSAPTLASAPEPQDFEQRKKDYFANLLRRKWECKASGHGVCVRTTDGRHHRVSDESFAKWVEALCIGEATTSQPPYGVLDNSEGNRKSLASSSRAVSLPPSRLRNIGSSALAASASFKSSQSSWASSGVPGPGYYAGKAIKWLGGRSLDAIDAVILFRRVQKYRDRLRSWDKADEIGVVGLDKQKKVYHILEEIMELSRPCYSSRVNKAAWYISLAVNEWRSAIPRTKEMAFFLCHIQICLFLANLNLMARFESAAEDLSSYLRDVLTRVPLALQDAATFSAVIQILALDLMYSPHLSDPSYRWLGLSFALIVAWTLELRSLTDAEMGAVRSISQRCELDCDKGRMACRTWEIALLADCSSQDQSFRDVVLGQDGIPSLFVALEFLLSDPVPDMENDLRDWEHLEQVLWALRKLSRHPWAVHELVRRSKLRLLLVALRTSPPNALFHIPCWAALTLHNMVRYSPSVLHMLYEENAWPVLGLARHALTSLPPTVKRGGAWLQKWAIESLDQLSEQIISHPENMLQRPDIKPQLLLMDK